MKADAIDWDRDLPPDADETYKSLVRSLKRTDGFALLFVRCSPIQADRVVADIRSDLPEKTIEVLELKESIDNLYDRVAALPNRDRLNVLFVKGLEYSIFAYEDREMHDITERSHSPLYGGTWKGVPRILGHLNLSRERFRDNFKFCFVFLLPEFALRYFIRRAPDFFDWHSNVYDYFSEKSLVGFEAFRLVYLDGNYEEYCEHTPAQFIEEKAKIKTFIEESQDPKQIVELWMKNGLIHLAANEHEEAIASYDKAIDLKPELHEAWNNRGVALGNLDRYEEAIASFDKALKINSNSHQAWCNRGDALFKLGLGKEAIKSYDRALSINPNNTEILYKKGHIEFDLGENQAAIFSYKEAIKNESKKKRKGYSYDTVLNRIFQCNLPRRTYSEFIGRETDVKKLMKFLSKDNRQPIISIAGIGGMGKTALAVDVAYQCLESKIENNPDLLIPNYEKIIFISAQNAFLTANGIITHDHTIHTLSDIYRSISRALCDYSAMSVTPEEQSKLIGETLSKQEQVLIIVDNLETLEESEKIIEFLVELPSNIKSIVTSRKQAEGTYIPIKLGPLSHDESKVLLLQSIQKTHVLLNQEEIELLCEACYGIPLAIIYSISCLSIGGSLQDILDELSSGNNDVTKFCFQMFFEKLELNSSKLLLALSLFPVGATKEALLKVSGLENEINQSVESKLEKLEQISLIYFQGGRYMMLPPTRGYVLTMLSKNPAFEVTARIAWKKWYLELIGDHGGDDWGNWHEDYDVIDSEWNNLLELLRWCKSNGEYKSVWDLWSKLNKIAYLYGHWTDRIYWLNYLIDELEKHNKLEELVEVLTSKAWTFIQIDDDDKLSEAKVILERAWALKSNTPANINYVTAIDLAILHLRKKQFKESERWFDHARNLLDEVEIIESEVSAPKNISRHRIRFNYYLGEKEHRLEQYGRAKEYLQLVEYEAIKVDWLRFVSASRELLADIAIREKRLEDAESYLQNGTHIAERNKDMRRLAFYLKSWAILEEQKHNFKLSNEYAHRSLDLFEGLRMNKRAKGMRDFISKLPH